MNGDEFEVLEAELRKLKPAQPPEKLVQQLVVAVSKRRPARSGGISKAARVLNLLYRRFSTCFHPDSVGRPADYNLAIQQIKNPRYTRWFGAGAVAVTIAMALWLRPVAETKMAAPWTSVAQARPGLKADNVEIDRKLLTSFDAVARLPGGEPVRFRCREWVDQVVLRDSRRGVVVEQRTPHLEVVPVGFETY
jgi:hypothetical protein